MPCMRVAVTYTLALQAPSPALKPADLSDVYAKILAEVAFVVGTVTKPVAGMKATRAKSNKTVPLT